MNKDLLWELYTNNPEARSIIDVTFEIFGIEMSKKTDVDIDFIEWWDYWKQTVPEPLSMGMGTKNTAKKHYTMFRNKYNYNNEEILTATRAYINDCIKHNRKTKLPQWFLKPQHAKDFDESELINWLTSNTTTTNYTGYHVI